MKICSDVTVIGGGIAGVCAAIAAARQGMAVALVQDRPVLGGNASSEIRMHIVGASRHGSRPNLRETGIIEELLLENKARNPEHSYGIFDMILWEKVRAEENIDLYLNTYAFQAEKSGSRIVSVKARQTTTEKELEFCSRQYIDCSGDGLISALSGAEYMFGRESRDTFGEPNAVEQADTVTMGNSIQFRSLDAGHPVPFERPKWAYDYSNAPWTKNPWMKWEEITSGYWWLELGGTQWNCVSDAELTRDEMMKILFGIWDYIKNHSCKKKEAENYYLDWVSFLPAKRESRRITGDYVLTENDVLENRIFPDAIAYGGWHLDSHRPEGFYAYVNGTPQSEDKTVHFDGIYTIPYRSIYARGIDNLLLGGRIISASHRAFSSTRVMATCAVAAEAAGIAAALAVRHGTTAAGVSAHMEQLQQLLLKNGCYIPGFRNEDPADLARTAAVTATGSLPGYEPENVINGISRPVGENSNMWQASRLGDSITLELGEARKVSELMLTFDSDLSVEIMISLSKWHHVRQSPHTPATLVRDYTLEYLLDGQTVQIQSVTGNCQRMNRHTAEVICDAVRITPTAMQGEQLPRVCEIRIYGYRGGL